MQLFCIIFSFPAGSCFAGGPYSAAGEAPLRIFDVAIINGELPWDEATRRTRTTNTRTTYIWRTEDTIIRCFKNYVCSTRRIVQTWHISIGKFVASISICFWLMPGLQHSAVDTVRNNTTNIKQWSMPHLMVVILRCWYFKSAFGPTARNI